LSISTPPVGEAGAIGGGATGEITRGEDGVGGKIAAAGGEGEGEGEREGKKRGGKKKRRAL